MEQKILQSAIQSKSAYEYIIKAEANLSDKGGMILKEIGEYYSKDPSATNVDVSILTNRLCRQYPKHKDLFKAALEGLPEDISVENIIEEVKDLKLRVVKQDLAAAFTVDGNEQRIE